MIVMYMITFLALLYVCVCACKDDERVLVELACAASLAAVYGNVIQRLQDEGRLRKPLGPLVVIVCGGSSVNRVQLQHLRAVCK